ncbi:MAG: hypothetical protein HYS86_04635 [Candidatus Chisholmbacteria bacterium]|nr:hypothetical protein [Candidatus Chisholmbacteria bacterium]
MTTRNHFNYFLLGITVVFLLLRLPQVLRNEFPFVFDMGRDHIWVRNMVELRKPTLVGPWGSLAGIYFGPAWYYLLAPAYIITGGDPRGSVITVMLVNLAALLAGSLFLKKEISSRAALFFALLNTFSTHNIAITTYPFHANVLPATMVVMLISLYYFLKGKPKYFWLAALASSFNFHFEPATGIFTTLTLIVFVILNWFQDLGRFFGLRPQNDGRPTNRLTLKPLIHAAIVFFIPFVPQIIFELRHNFIQSKALLLYFQGGNESLEGKLPFSIRLGERIRKFTELFSSSIVPNLPLLIVGVILAITILILWRIKKTKNEQTLFSLILFSLVLPLLGFMFLFPPELKTWYLYGFSINYFILVALFLNKIIRANIIGYWFTPWRSFTGLLAMSFFVWQGQIHTLLPGRQVVSSPGPAILSTQKKVITMIYERSQNEPFSIYVYTPPIYDYHYQYVIWFMSRKNNWPLPIEYSYLPNEVGYHPQKEYFSSTSSASPKRVFLVIEPERIKSLLYGWLGHFAAYPTKKQCLFGPNVIVQTRLPPET